MIICGVKNYGLYLWTPLDNNSNPVYETGKSLNIRYIQDNIIRLQRLVFFFFVNFFDDAFDAEVVN